MGLANGVPYLVQVVGVEGTTKDESNLKYVMPLDGVAPPREVQFCGAEDIEGTCSAPVQAPSSLRLTFKYPESLGGGNTPTDFDCEVSSNGTNFPKGVGFTTTFPYEGGQSPWREELLKKTITIPDNMIGMLLYVRLRLPNNIGTGHWGTSQMGVFSLKRPTAPEIVLLKSAVSVSDGQSLKISVREPHDIGDGGYRRAPALIFEIFIASSGDVDQVFNSGTTPPSAFFTSSPGIGIANITLSKSNFASALRNQVTTVLSVQNTVFVWARANNQRRTNFLLSSSRTEARSILVAGLPGAISMVILILDGDLAMELSWTPPDDKGLGANALMYYAIQSYQYARIGSDTSIITLLENPVTVGPDENSLRVSLTGLQKGLVYFYSVRAVNDVGFGPWFNLQTTCESYPVNNRPSNCGFEGISFPSTPVLQGFTRGNGYVTAMWQYPSDPGTGTAGSRVNLTYTIEFESLKDGTIATAQTEGKTNKTYTRSIGQISG